MILLPKVPGIVFAYDVRQNVTLEPLETQAVGKFDYAVASVEDVSGNSVPMLRRSGGVDPYRAMQVPYSPRSGINGIAPYGSYPDAYAPAFDMLAEQQSNLETPGYDGVNFRGFDTFLDCSFVVLAAMRAATVTDARLLSYMGIGGADGGQDDGRVGCLMFARDGLTNAIKTHRAAVDPLGSLISTPIALDTLYRFGLVMDDTLMTQYLNNVAGASGPAYVATPMNSPGKMGLGGPANGFTGHNGSAWDGPILFAIGSNVAWNEEERAIVDDWIVGEFNL